jgi:uncharacterized protein
MQTPASNQVMGRFGMTPSLVRVARLRGRFANAAMLSLCGAAIWIGGCTGCSSTDATTGRSTTGGTTTGRASDALRRYPLDTLPTTTVQVDGHSFRAWLADESDLHRPGVVNEGLMFVPTSEIADDQGMLFVFPEEQIRSFWMKNTVAPLDIAFARMNGTIVKIWQMPPQTLQTFSSIEPAMFALELKQGTFAQLGIHEGDRLEIPVQVAGVQPQ